MLVIDGGRRICVRPVPELPTLLQFKLLCRHILCHSSEEGVNQRVRVSLSTLTGVATVLEAGSYEHLPDSGVSPVVSIWLGPNLDVKVVVVAFEHSRDCPVLVPVKANHVLSHLLESLVEGSFIVLSLTLSIGDHASTIAAEDEHTTVVHSIQLGHIGHTVRVHED